MGLYTIHMFLLLGVILSFAVVFLSGSGKKQLYISSDDGTGKQRTVRRASPMPIENIAFFLIGIACVVALYLTNFNLCTFLGYWVPGINLAPLYGICGIG